MILNLFNYLKKKRSLKSKKGGVILLIDLLVLSLFPIIIVQIIDSCNIYFIDKHLSSCLDLSVKSASIYEDDNITTGIPDGFFYIDSNKANTNFYNIFDLNYHNIVAFSQDKTINPSIEDVQRQIFIYNNFPNTLVDFPNTGSMSTTTLGKDLLGSYNEFQIKVKRPTVLGVARVRYKTFYGKEIDILRYSSSQIINTNTNSST